MPQKMNFASKFFACYKRNEYFIVNYTNKQFESLWVITRKGESGIQLGKISMHGGDGAKQCIFSVFL